MANNQVTEWISVDELVVFAGALERMAARARAIGESVLEMGENGLYSFGGYSMRTAEERAVTFLRDLEDSADQLAAGRPYDQKATKKRLRGKALKEEYNRREKLFKAGKHRK
ncbi:MAG: hypothetical protein CMK32_07740 [Porticoccaceae bacterium]|nr:hypothetical protein [Porticoccaceae bacterium]